jgi:hypothetical protein
MPIRTGYVRDVKERPYRSFTRFDVCFSFGLVLYTQDALKASFCKRSMPVGRAVTCQTRETQFGEEIVGVDYLAHPQEQAS